MSIPRQLGLVRSWHKHGLSNDNAARGRLFDVIDKREDDSRRRRRGFRDDRRYWWPDLAPSGVADHLLDALHEQGARELTIVANNSGNGDYGWPLINSGRVRKVICSYPRSGDSSAFLKAYRAKSLS